MKDAAPASATSSVDRYTQISLYLLLVTGVLTLLSTGKVDLVSVLTASAALLVKGARSWPGYGPQLSHRLATRLGTAYFLFFPLPLGNHFRRGRRVRAHSWAGNLPSISAARRRIFFRPELSAVADFRLLRQRRSRPDR